MKWIPKNRTQLVAMPFRVKTTSVDLPAQTESDFHLAGLSFKPIEEVRRCNSSISFWCLLLSLVMRLKSSANGKVMFLTLQIMSILIFNTFQFFQNWIEANQKDDRWEGVPLENAFFLVHAT